MHSPATSLGKPVLFFLFSFFSFNVSSSANHVAAAEHLGIYTWWRRTAEAQTELQSFLLIPEDRDKRPSNGYEAKSNSTKQSLQSRCAEHTTAHLNTQNIKHRGRWYNSRRQHQRTENWEYILTASAKLDNTRFEKLCFVWWLSISAKWSIHTGGLESRVK